MTESEVEAFYNVSYREAGITAQRRYPNEEMLRFLGKNFSGVPVAAKRDIKVLEVGCRDICRGRSRQKTSAVSWAKLENHEFTQLLH